MTQNPTSVKIMRFSAQLYRKHLGQLAENQSVVVVVIIKSLCSSREESEQMPVSFEVKPNHVHMMWDQDTLKNSHPNRAFN